MTDELIGKLFFAIVFLVSLGVVIGIFLMADRQRDLRNINSALNSYPVVVHEYTKAENEYIVKISPKRDVFQTANVKILCVNTDVSRTICQVGKNSLPDFLKEL